MADAIVKQTEQKNLQELFDNTFDTAIIGLYQIQAVAKAMFEFISEEGRLDIASNGVDGIAALAKSVINDLNAIVDREGGRV